MIVRVHSTRLATRAADKHCDPQQNSEVVMCPPERGGPTYDLRRVLEELAGLYGPAPPPPSADAFELILWENVAYLANDEQRAEALASLRRTVGTSAAGIHKASSADLAEAVGKGILPDASERKLRTAADIVVSEFGGDLSMLSHLPLREARKLLQRFPGIGEPAAEKILLELRRHPALTLESNGLRVLVRLGYCSADLSYAAAYRAARSLGAQLLGADFDLLLLARHVLRRHGQTICRRSKPACDECVLRRGCQYGSGKAEIEAAAT
jgi:endonuclease III